jgi:hypothetical protein
LLHASSGDGAAARELLTLDDRQRSRYSMRMTILLQPEKTSGWKKIRLLRGQRSEQDPLSVDYISFETTFQDEEKTRLALIISSDRIIISFINLAWVYLGR